MKIEPDIGIPFEQPPFDFMGQIAATCKTIDDLGIKSEVDDPEVVVGKAEAIIESVAAGDMKTAVKIARYSPPAALQTVQEIVDRYGSQIAANAADIRKYVTHRLIEESDHPDPRIRLRSLELLGKITDVGLFTEKAEVTVTHKSTADLVESLREKLLKLKDINEPSSKSVTIDHE